MPRLPDASQLGAPEQLQSRGVVRTELGQEARAKMQTGQAITQAGRQVFEMGQRIQEREDRLNYVKEKSSFLQKSVETESKFDGDTDYKTFGTRYTEDMQKAKQVALAKIQNPDMRAQFDADADLDISQGIARMGAKSWGLEKSNGIAGMNETLSRNRELYLTAGDDGVRSSVLNNSKQAIEMAKLNGYISPEEAEDMGRKSAQDYVVGRISVLPPDQRIAVLNQKGGIGDLVPEDMKVALIEKAESEGLSNLRNLEWMAQQSRETLFNTASLQVEQTGSTAGIAPEQWASMDKGQRDSLTTYARNIAEGNHIPTDWNTYYQLKTKAASPETRKAFEREDLTKYRGKLGPTEYKELIGAQATLREGKNDKALDGYLTKAQIVNDSLGGIGIDPTPKPGKQAKEVAEFRRMVDTEITALQNQTGKEATNEEVQRITDKLIVQGRVPGSGIIWDDTKRRFQLKTGEKLIVKDAGEVPMAEREKIESALRNKGRPVNDQTILQLYNQKLSKEL
jgi:hypothetical protein